MTVRKLGNGKYPILRGKQLARNSTISTDVKSMSLNTFFLSLVSVIVARTGFLVDFVFTIYIMITIL